MSRKTLNISSYTEIYYRRIILMNFWISNILLQRNVTISTWQVWMTCWNKKKNIIFRKKVLKHGHSWLPIELAWYILLHAEQTLNLLALEWHLIGCLQHCLVRRFNNFKKVTNSPKKSFRMDQAKTRKMQHSLKYRDIRHTDCKNCNETFILSLNEKVM